ncbi:hypothetical protein LA080_007638 [Diaporthe eres]|nr:hypothetical protein LA080_007638 [Diaporthe eres]
MPSDWLLGFYILHVIANGLSLWLLHLRRIVPEEEPKPVSGQSLAVKVGKPPQTRAVEPKAGVSYGGHPPGQRFDNSGPRERNRPPPEHQKPRLSHGFGVLSHLIKTPPPVSAGEPLRRDPQPGQEAIPV